MDYPSIATLLHVLEKTRQEPSLKSIHDMAMLDLRAVAKETQVALDERIADEKAKAVAEEDARRKKLEEERLAAIGPDPELPRGPSSNGLNLRPRSPGPGDA